MSEIASALLVHELQRYSSGLILVIAMVAALARSVKLSRLEIQRVADHPVLNPLSSVLWTMDEDQGRTKTQARSTTDGTATRTATASALPPLSAVVVVRMRDRARQRRMTREAP
jgi:hypothetical protein